MCINETQKKISNKIQRGKKKLLKTDMIIDGRKYIVIILRGIFM